MDTYYAVKLNDGEKHIIYANNKELEHMIEADIIKEYITALDNWSTEKIYQHYILTRLEDEVADICCHIQNAKGIENGDCPPDLSMELAKSVSSLSDVIKEIIAFQEELKNEHNK